LNSLTHQIWIKKCTLFDEKNKHSHIWVKKMYTRKRPFYSRDLGYTYIIGPPEISRIHEFLIKSSPPVIISSKIHQKTSKKFRSEIQISDFSVIFDKITSSHLRWALSIYKILSGLVKIYLKRMKRSKFRAKSHVFWSTHASHT